MILCSALACLLNAAGAGPYPVRVAADHRHLVDQSGAPFLIHGDTPWSLIVGLTRQEAEQYLENRRRKGFDSIIVNLIEHKYRGPVNRYGEGPFTTPGDFSTPNEKYFEHADWVIRKAAEKGIQIFLRPSTWDTSAPMKAGSKSRSPTVRKSAAPGGNLWAGVIVTSIISCGSSAATAIPTKRVIM